MEEKTIWKTATFSGAAKDGRTGMVLFLFRYWLVSGVKLYGGPDRKRLFSQLTAEIPYKGAKLFLTN